MPVDYSAIATENEIKYGTEVANYGPKLLADRYSDPTHFVYELLQNAEDALSERFSLFSQSSLPRAAHFALFKNRLEFRHFGIPFNETHIRAICDIARTSKTKNPRAIGQFGIGFKSVYAFTRSPEIHSGEESFSIESLVRPSAIPARPTADGETLFVLPFNNKDLLSTECYHIIAKRLFTLGLRTLLFLCRVNEISWTTDGGFAGRYVRETTTLPDGVQRVSLIGEEKGKSTKKEQWLLFSRSIERTDETNGKVEIAFQLLHSSDKRKNQIQRVKDSPLFVYFATDLQTHFGFLLQGTFNLTQNRDNIRRKDEWNRTLAKEVGHLTADSLFILKKLGLLSTSALDALPLEEELFRTETGQLFFPVYEAVMAALRKRPLIPGIGKTFVAGNNGVLVRGRELAGLFKTEQLKLLFCTDKDLHWISPDITDKKATRRLYQYLRDALNIDEIDTESLASRMDDTFFAEQNINWFCRFYRFLLKHQSLWSDGGQLRDRAIIRLADGSNVPPFCTDGANAYLPGNADIGHKTVDPRCAKGEALTFLQRLGLRKRDLVAEVLEDVLPAYDDGEMPSQTKHRSNLRLIFRALDKQDSVDHNILKEKLQETAFINCVNVKSNEREFKSPTNLTYFRSKDLHEYFKGEDDCWLVNEPTLSKKDRLWLTELGVCDRPALRDWQEAYERRVAEIAPDQPNKRIVEYIDYHLHGLDSVLKRIKRMSKGQPKAAARLSLILWQYLTIIANRENGTFLRGNLKWKRRSQQRQVETYPFDAFYIERLREEPWLPNRKWQFSQPEKMRVQDLRACFKRNQLLCQALGFKTPLSETLKGAGLPGNLIKLLEVAQNYPDFAEECLRTWRSRSITASRNLPTSNNSHRAAASRPGSTPPGPAESPAGAIAALLGPGASVTPPPPELDLPEVPVGTAPGTGGDTDAQASPEAGPPATGEGSARPRNAQRQPSTGKLRSYVVRNPSPPDGPPDSEASAHRDAVAEAGIAKVVAFEQRCQRHPDVKPPNHEGYDIESRDAAGEITRYIEVKSISGPWNACGVGVTYPEFAHAQQLGNKFWLYVVDRADQPEARIYQIQDPARRVDQFMYDDGWSEAAEPPEETSCHFPNISSPLG